MKENVSYHERNSEWKNIVLSQNYRIFKSRKYIQLYARANFNRDSPKINIEIYILLHFLSEMLETWKLCSRD